MNKISNFKIIISKEVQTIFKNYKQKNIGDKEACGILIGEHSFKGDRISISKATEPRKEDIRKKYFFKIKSDYHQKYLDECYKNSNYESVYIGTWHTHPEINPFPSKIDTNDWKKQYNKNYHLFNKMIFIIVGLENINAWLIENNKTIKLPNENIVLE